MRFAGRDLKEIHSVALVTATNIYNKHQKTRIPDWVDITPETYLWDLLDKQLDGLIEGVAMEKEINTAREEAKLNQARDLEQARRRVGIL